MSNFAVASSIHHNALGRRLNKFYKELLSTLHNEQIQMQN